MSPEEIKALRQLLRCTTRELGDATETDQKTVIAWEAGQLFPTKKHVEQLRKLAERGPSAIVRRPRGNLTPMQVLKSPQLWELVRKLVAHKKLREDALKMAEDYPDPSEE